MDTWSHCFETEVRHCVAENLWQKSKPFHLMAARTHHEREKGAQGSWFSSEGCAHLQWRNFLPLGSTSQKIPLAIGNFSCWKRRFCKHVPAFGRYYTTAPNPRKQVLQQGMGESLRNERVTQKSCEGHGIEARKLSVRVWLRWDQNALLLQMPRHVCISGSSARVACRWRIQDLDWSGAGVLLSRDNSKHAKN